jgi:hypothetical protein
VNRATLPWSILSCCIILLACNLLGAGASKSRAMDTEAGLAGGDGTMAAEQGYVNDRSIQIINSLDDPEIESLGDAEAYVRQVARACGVQGPVLTKGLLPRLAEGELAAAQDPSRLVSDDNVAEAFNFLSREFQAPHPQVLTGNEVLQFRTAMSAIYPHVFSPKSVPGSRPTQALIMLHQLVFNGGVPQGAKNLAQTDPQPGSRRIDSSRGRLVPKRDVNIVAREYQVAASRYFRGLSHREFQHFVRALEQIMALPDGR